MLELPDFGHMTIYRIKLESNDEILLVMPWAKIMTS